MSKIVEGQYQSLDFMEPVTSKLTGQITILVSIPKGREDPSSPFNLATPSQRQGHE